MDIKKDIARLVQFAKLRGLLGEEDEIAATNALLDLLQVEAPYDGEMDGDLPKGPVEILDPILDYAAHIGLLPANNSTYRDLLDARIMGLLMPRQSEVTRSFWDKSQEESSQAATTAFYQMSIDSNYIRMNRIAKNEYWLSPTPFGELEITINLSKPEKDPKEIAAERSAPQSHYPKCLLCLENVGYAGRLNHPARQNHRVIPIELDGNPWYLQYSPYVYYNEHSIVFSREHTPMTVSRASFVRLLDFVRQFPHYFIGSNADLPIVGGSILNHDHFQGGRHIFPMEKALVERSFAHPDYVGVSAGVVNWPLSVIRISGLDRERLTDLADTILQQWRSYSDSQAEILAFTEQADGTSVPHNTITPIARMNEKGEYELDLVLRNNRTSEEHPLGIFHPHAELHHIKKENIGLIEVMGLAVLPGRLKQEMGQIAEWLCQSAEARMVDAVFIGDESLAKHREWMTLLSAKYPEKLQLEDAMASVQQEIGTKFAHVLLDAGVYKQTDEGKCAFERFLENVGFAANPY